MGYCIGQGSSRFFATVKFTTVLTEKTPVEQCFPNVFVRRSLLASKNNQGLSHICLRKYSVPGRWVYKIKIYILDLTLDSYKYIPVIYVTTHCMIYLN